MVKIIFSFTVTKLHGNIQLSKTKEIIAYYFRINDLLSCRECLEGKPVMSNLVNNLFRPVITRKRCLIIKMYFGDIWQESSVI